MGWYAFRGHLRTLTCLFAGVPVSGLDTGIDWYTRFFGRPPDMRAGDEILWDIDEHATLFIEPNAAQAGSGRITLGVAGLDALLERLAADGIEHEPVETYSNGVCGTYGYMHGVWARSFRSATSRTRSIAR